MSTEARIRHPTATPETTLVLASGSPRRSQLLQQMGIPHEILAPELDEREFTGNSPSALVRELARAKAAAVRDLLPDGVARWILAADTVVVASGTTLGKPSGLDDAERMMRALSGRTHQVLTGLAVWIPGARAALVRRSRTRVTFARLSATEITTYLASGEWRGVAGAYRIQGRAALFIDHISGSYSNVVGLPIHLVYSILTQHGFRGFC